LEIDLVVLRLDLGTMRAEIPLLPHNLMERIGRAAGPLQAEFLRSSDPGFLEPEADVFNGLRLIEDQPDSLFARRSSPPAGARAEGESRLDGIAIGFGRDLHVRHFVQLEPLATVWHIAGRRS